MTLKEKFDEIHKSFINGDFVATDLIKEECEKIADEFAIGFAKWISMRCYITKDNSYWLVRNEGDIKKNTKELLEIYKKQLGL